MLPSDESLDARLAEWRRVGAPHQILRDADRARLMHRIDLNGMGPLLALTTDVTSLPQDLAQLLQHRLLAREMWEEQHKRVLALALDALTDAGLSPILMKGTALAYSHYPRPSARVRGDSDLLVEEDGRAWAFEALEKAGFRRTLAVDGTTAWAEALFQKADLTGQLHDIDLHWRLNSSPVLARLFTHAELFARSKPFESLHLVARRLGDVDALLFAAVHRRLHIDRPTHIYLNGVAHPVIDSLSWLIDIALLFDAMDTDTRSDLVERAISKAIADVLSDTLVQMSTRLGYPIETDILKRLDIEGPRQVSRYIAAGPLQSIFMNLSATKGLRRKIRFLREVLLPDEDYMRARFARGRFDWLAVLHVRRLLPGAIKYLRARRSKS